MLDLYLILLSFVMGIIVGLTIRHKHHKHEYISIGVYTWHEHYGGQEHYKTDIKQMCYCLHPRIHTINGTWTLEELKGENL